MRPCAYINNDYNGRSMKKDKITDLGGELTDIPNDQYVKFFGKFSEIDTIDVANWKPLHLIAFFCRKFEAAYETKYKFKYNSPSPGKSYEIFQIKKLAQMLSSQPQILKEYIDWAFREKVEKAGKRFTSISFLTNEELVKDYKLNVLMSNKSIDRTTLLPGYVKLLFQELGTIGQGILTYGDLSFIYQIVKGGGFDKATRQQFIKILDEAHKEGQKTGFDKSILEKIK